MGKLKHVVLVGANLLAQGYTDFDVWSEKMIQEFGPGVEPCLADILISSQELQGPLAENIFAQLQKTMRRLLVPKNVLVVDDEPNIVLSLKFLIAQEGYDVRTAGSGVEALQAVAEQVPDLILLMS